MLSTGRATLDELKQALARRAGEPESAPAGAPWPTGLVELDALLGGGLPRGRVSELAGPRSSGKATVALGAAARATQQGQLVAWVDSPEELYPPAAAAMGLELSRLLLVRPGAPAGGAALAAARAGEILARSRAFALVIVDLGATGVMPERAAARLRQVAHEAAVALVVLSPRPGAVAHAGLALAVSSLGAQAVDELGRRRLRVNVTRGGAPLEARVSLGAPGLAAFRGREQQLELLAAAQAIRPVSIRRTP